ncbi:MAG: GntR family transcriptional regulator [Pseudomonadota bacterium]
MQKSIHPLVTRTTTDIVFDHLYDEILSLRLLPGARISEAEIASQMGVSRQPVRDAFNRLANLDLVLIRPQRATVVRGFSLDAIETARFVRLAIELEVVSRSCANWGEAQIALLEEQLTLQHEALKSGETGRFHELDYAFHKLICDHSGYPLAFEAIENSKRSVDRLCVLSLRKTHEVAAIIEDHEDIATALAKRSQEDVRTAVHKHLSRLDETVREIHDTHASYFE